ncbi:MAG: GTP-binding protein TypA, partial [Polynucleobacter sp. 39-45-136]
MAIIAHVDHGKTTLVDQLLRQSGTFRSNEKMTERVMDSNDLEKERGITILSKNCAVEYDGTHINIVDTPGHADFGGEVERVLSMVDGVLLLVDAVEGPMPQTRFVTKKALALGLKPIVVINKVDRPGARTDYVINATFELFDKLGATEEQLDFPVVYASGLNGYAGLTDDVREGDMRPLFDTVLKHVPVRDDNPEGPLQLQITSIEYSTYVGKIGVGRVNRGTVKPLMDVVFMDGPDGVQRKGRINQVLKFRGLERELVDEAQAGDIVLVNGIEDLAIGTTICSPDTPEALPMLKIDEPTLTMNFDDDTVFEVSGRGELHLTILVETMRREGYELAVSRPRVVFHEENGVKMEPYENLTVDVEDTTQGAVMEDLGKRKGELLDMVSDGKGRTRLEYRIPARGLIGFQGDFMTMTRGNGLMSHTFDSYAPAKDGILGERH